MSAEDRRYFHIALAIIAAITAIRVAVLVLSPLDLYPDEAQYWWWSQNPDWGYFSKPPMIGWVIWLTTAIFGQAEWAIRIGSPLLHAMTALLLFGIARRCFDARTAMFAALAYLTTPGASYSSGLISTDVPLLFFWAIALYAFLRAMDDPRWRWPILAGIAFGLGLEAKYAMFYVLPCAGFAALFSPKARKVVLGGRGAAILAIGLLLLLPNVLWNAAHHFPTVAHTEHNADWAGARYSLSETASFIGGQFGVFGPILMVGLLLMFWKLARGPERSQGSLVLAAFCAPPLILIIVQSFISEANANWAATAYVAATPLAVAALIGLWDSRLLWASFVLDGLVMAVLWLILLSPSFANGIGLGNAFKRMEGWRELGTAVADEAQQGHYALISAANRSIMAELLYYAAPRTAFVRMWDKDLHDDDHFQMTLRLTVPAHRVLMVVSPQEAPAVLGTFDSNTLADTVTVPIGGRHIRVTQLYDARDYRGPQTSQ
ncbi:MAG: glycosyltransferase family 39 protein [Proteobacteria bacterium]|nr:glycosyltransferase family 39 protein [Pseudomonadota bacterium]